MVTTTSEEWLIKDRRIGPSGDRTITIQGGFQVRAPDSDRKRCAHEGLAFHDATARWLAAHQPPATESHDA